MLYMITLDAHEYFGPFVSADHAHLWATKTGRTSYQLVTKLPEYAIPLCRIAYAVYH